MPKSSIFSAEGIAEVADTKLLEYLMAGLILFLVVFGVLQLLVTMKRGERQWFRTFGNHIIDELSSASTHAAFAYLFSMFTASVVSRIGAIARPRRVVIVPDMPKTRSGKIMRRVLAAISNHQDPGDVSTLANPEIVEQIKELAR